MKRELARIWCALKDHAGLDKTAPIFGGLIIVLTAALEASALALIIPFLDLLTQGDNSALPTGRIAEYSRAFFSTIGVPYTAEAIAATILATVSVRELCSYCSTVYFANLISNTEKSLRDKLLGVMLKARISAGDVLGSGAFVEMISVHAMRAAQLFQSLTQVGSTAVTIMAYGAVLLFTSPLSLLIGVGVIGLSMWALTHSVRKVRDLGEESVVLQSGFSQKASEIFQLRRLLKIGEAEDREFQISKDATNSLKLKQIAIAKTGVITRSVLMLSIMIIVLVGALVVSGNGAFDLVATTAAVLVVMRILPLAMSLGRMRQAVANRLPYLLAISDAIEQFERQPEPRGGPVSFGGLQKGIFLKNVSMHYSDAKEPALSEVSATFPAGRMTALIGPSGAGKSSLIDLLPRLNEPSSGEILFDELELKEYSMSSLRHSIAMMPQVPLLTNDTILENVRYFNPSASEAEVQEACRLANATDFIDRQPQGYQTKIGEAGGRLSGGERQRLALARALLSDAKILILDEPTSAVDPKSEQKIRTALNALKKSRALTVIVIAHRRETIASADHVIALENGRLKKTGSPKDLELDDNWFDALMS
ncbi:MAG: ABC transporter ATP-binding protein [Rhizobiaceae bacterium]